MAQFYHKLNWRIILLFMRLLIIVVVSRSTIHPAYGQAGETTYEIDLATLGYPTTSLTGPSDSTIYNFSLPPNWMPRPGSYLQLDLSYHASSQTNVAPALLAVELNGELLHTEALTTSTTASLRVDIPPEMLYLAEASSINRITIDLRVAGRCEEAHASTWATIDSSSTLRLIYRERPLPLDLALYPKPLYYRRAFETTPARIVLPSQPNTTELQAAAMIAANLGSLTNDNLTLEVSLDDAASVRSNQQHLVMIGPLERLSLLSELDLPLPLRERRLSLRSQMPAAVSPAQSFSYTLTVENTSNVTQSLTVEDRLSPLVSVEACPACNQVTADWLQWNVEELPPGRVISTVVQALPDEFLTVGPSVEHTASLLDESGQVINVDTLTTTVALEADPTPISSASKGPYFFSLQDYGVPETDGIIQLVESPWSVQRAVIAVTGLSEASISLAAHALAAQSSVPGMHGQFALVQATNPPSVTLSSTTQDITLAELGYEDIVTRGRYGVTEIRFEVPHNVTLAEEAYLALHLAHGTALDAISATLELSLNNLPFYSIELHAENAVDTWLRIQLPGRRLKGGTNQLSMDVSADWPVCLGRDELDQLWVTIYADSFLHLPYADVQTPSLLDLADYPRFLSTDPGLKDLVLLVPEQVTADEAQGMVQLLSFLGSAARGSYFTPHVIPSGQVEAEQWRDHHLMVLGRPTRNPYITLMNNELPQPFIPGRDEIRQQVDHVIYRLPPGYDLGLIQLLPVPWSQGRTMLVGTGTTDVGLRWALQALSDKRLSRDMKGNLAVMVGEDEMRTADTRQSRSETQSLLPPTKTSALIVEATITPIPTSTQAHSPTPPGATPTAPAPAREPSDTLSSYRPPLWQIGMLVLSGAVAVGLLGIIVMRRRFP